MTTTWSTTFPDTPGWYWFYGLLPGSSRVRLCAWHVVKVSNGLAHVVDGSFAVGWCYGRSAFESEQKDYAGVWQVLSEPILPS